MKVSKETINGKEYTVVWHEKPHMILGRRFTTMNDGSLAVFYDNDCLEHIATALPALPRNPKPEDAPLLYRYMAEGIVPWFYYESKNGKCTESCPWIDMRHRVVQGVKITHATDKEGNRIEVAIAGGE